jgi:hypothetical protein
MKDMANLQGRVTLHGEYGDARNGVAIIWVGEAQLRVLFSDGGGWDHVSVSTLHRCPTWAEMCAVKRLFFAPEDVVVQYHPRESEYRNCHPYCLHLWRCQYATFPTPDPFMVAP